MRDFIVKTIVGKIGGGGHGTVTYYGAQLAADDILSELTRRAALKNKEQPANTAALFECDACGWRGKQDALKPPHSLSDELPACPECASDEIGEVSALPQKRADNTARDVIALLEEVVAHVLPKHLMFHAERTGGSWVNRAQHIIDAQLHP